MTEDAPESFEAKLEQLEALDQALQVKNLELRLRLQQRKSRWGFERQLLAIGGLGLLFVGLVVGLFLGLVVGSVRPLAAGAAVWTPDHVVIVIEENLSARNLVPELTYLTSLQQQGANFTDSHGVDHPSQPNYLALFSGDPQGTGSDTKRNPDRSNPIVNGHTQVGTDDPLPNTPLDTRTIPGLIGRRRRMMRSAATSYRRASICHSLNFRPMMTGSPSCRHSLSSFPTRSTTATSQTRRRRRSITARRWTIGCSST